MINHDIKYRIAQLFRIISADYLIQLHLPNGDNSQDEVEQIQGYIGNAICDGRSLEWEHRKLFQDIIIEDVHWKKSMQT